MLFFPRISNRLAKRRGVYIEFKAPSLSFMQHSSRKFFWGQAIVSDNLNGKTELIIELQTNC